MTHTFTIHHLRFTVEAETTIEMGTFKGSALRGAWESHLRTLYCAERDSTDPLHATLCPVCYLLNREADPRDNRRPYAFEPPLTSQTVFQAGEMFAFGISMFGKTIQFLPYIVLSVQQMGQTQGLGKPIHAGYRRGRFRLVRIEETNPLTGAGDVLFEAGNPVVRMPRLPVTAEQVAAASEALARELAGRDNRLTLEFLTPTRIVHEERLAHRPEFVPLMARLVDRIGTLRSQFADDPPVSYEEKGALLALAADVECVRDDTVWWDVRGHSTRLGRS
ncbi:MAG: hypothetical protein ACPL7R_10795, partial [Anaerolineae bacterium]